MSEIDREAELYHRMEAREVLINQRKYRRRIKLERKDQKRRIRLEKEVEEVGTTEKISHSSSDISGFLATFPPSISEAKN